MPSPRFSLFAAVFLIMERNDSGAKQLLLMRRANTGWHDGEYSFGDYTSALLL